jgi:hypothetical protein
MTAAEREAREVASVLDDVDEWRGRSVAEKLAAFRGLCRLSAELLAASPVRDRALAWQDPRAPEDEALWQRLIERNRG